MAAVNGLQAVRQAVLEVASNTYIYFFSICKLMHF